MNKPVAWRYKDSDDHKCNYYTHMGDSVEEHMNKGCEALYLSPSDGRNKTLEEVQALLDHSLEHYKQLIENQFTNCETKAIVASSVAFIMKFQEAVQQLR